MTERYDVAIIGGGPGGSTTAAMLKKYAPGMSVAIFERERFPRDHVGESLLPVVSRVLDEMGCWHKIEGAGFPVKVGATYRWGSSDDLWDFDFLNGTSYDDAPRPAPYLGQRTKTAFQVDRALYDQILLDHAESMGVQVFQEAPVGKVVHGGGKVESLLLRDGREIQAKHYVDASGHSGIVRRSLGIETDEATALKNIAVWAYWQNADWAVNIGVSGTRIQVMSLGWGWIWFIPLGPTRTSIGLVMPADRPKTLGRTVQSLYDEALAQEPRIKGLLAKAQREPALHTTKDWSFISSKTAGPNWFLVGESAGFADPILSAGLTLTHMGAWETAIAIVELERGQQDGEWIRTELERQHRKRVLTHIRFADYWYASNAHFTDLIDYAAEIAKESGLALDGSNAWQWLGTGGFVDTDLGGAGVGGFSLLSAGWIVRDFSKTLPSWNVGKSNVFSAEMAGAEPASIAAFRPGSIDRIPAYRRGEKLLPATEVCGFLLELMNSPAPLERIVHALRASNPAIPLPRGLQVLEAMINDGWVSARHDPSKPLIDAARLMDMAPFHKTVD